MTLKDPIDINEINFSNTTNVNFIKTYYITDSSGRPLVLNIKCINNTIFIHSIQNTKTRLLHIVRLTSTDYESVCSNIKINSSWTKLSIPERDRLYVYDIQDLLKKRQTTHFIDLDSSDRTTVQVRLYDTKAIILYADRDTSVIDHINIHNLMDSTVKTIRPSNLYVNNLIISNNSRYFMIIKRKIIIIDSEDYETDRFVLNYDYDSQEDSQWLLSDGGDVLVNRSGRSAKIILLDKQNNEVYTTKISDCEGILMLNSVNISEDIRCDVLTVWDKKNTMDKITLYGILNRDDNYTVSNGETLDIQLLKDSKVSTNGRVFVCKNRDESMTVNIKDLLRLTSIALYSGSIVKRLRESFTKSVPRTVLFGNMVTQTYNSVDQKTRHVLDPLAKNNRLIMNTYDSLDIPIIESDRVGMVCSGKDYLNSIDIYVLMLSDMTVMMDIFRALEGDILYESKIEVLFNTLSSIFEYFFKDVKDNERLDLSKRYHELCLLYTSIAYRYTDTSYEEKWLNVMLNNITSFDH